MHCCEKLQKVTQNYTKLSYSRLPKVTQVTEVEAAHNVKLNKVARRYIQNILHKVVSSSTNCSISY